MQSRHASRAKCGHVTVQTLRQAEQKEILALSLGENKPLQPPREMSAIQRARGKGPANVLH